MTLLAMLSSREPWMVRAACRGLDPDLFFPVRGEDLRAAKAVCATCDVRDECLDYALRTHETCGVWGGTSERQRRRLRHRQRVAA